MKAKGIKSNVAIKSIFLMGDLLSMQRMCHVADFSHSIHSFERVEEISKILLQHPHFVGEGLYYAGLATKNVGSQDLTTSTALLESAVRLAPKPYQARALLALASNARSAGDFASEIALNAAVVKMQADPLASIRAVSRCAILQSQAGDHDAALRTFENLAHPVALLAQERPEVYPDLANSIAVELAALGRLRAAEAASKVATSSPYAQFWPNWGTQAQRIAEILDRPTSIRVYVPETFARHAHKTRIAYVRTYVPIRKRRLFYLLQAKLVLMDGLPQGQARKIGDLLDPDYTYGPFSSNEPANLCKINAILLKVRNRATEEALNRSLRLLGLKSGDIPDL